jgi:hypothetical protein
MSINSFEQALRKDLPHHWREAEAEITSCGRMHYSQSIQPPYCAASFTYMVDGVEYTDATNSPVEVQRGGKFMVRYNPEHPEENNSLVSECERPWFKVYLDLSYAVVIGLLLYGIVRTYFLRR